MAEIIDDVSSCLTTLSFISQEWVSLWTVRASAAAASHSTMVTSAADHAIVIRDILAALHTQTMDAFGDLHCEDGRVTWPRNPIPFNHIMLEAELLVRTGPNMDVTNASSPTYITTATQVKSAPETFLSLLISYSRTTRQLVLSWASSRGKGQSVDDERAFMDARKELQDAYESFDLFLSMIQDRFSSGGGEGDGDDHRPPPPF